MSFIIRLALSLKLSKFGVLKKKIVILKLLYKIASVLGLLIFFLVPFSLKGQGMEFNVKVLNCIDMGGRYFSSPIETPSGNVVIGNHRRLLTFFNSSGEKVKELVMGGWIHATPDLFEDSLVTVGCYDKCMYVCSQEGEVLDKIKQEGRVFTNTVDMHDGRMLFGMNTKGVVMYNVKNNITKIYRTTKLMHGSPLVLSNGNIVIGGNNKKLLYFDENLNLINKYKAEGWFMHSQPLELSNGNIIAGSYDDCMHFVSPYGEPIAKFKTQGKIHASPVETCAGKIVFGSFDGYIYILNEDGTLFNKIKTNKKVVASAATLNDGTLVIPSFDKYLYFISPEGHFLGKKEIGSKIFSTPLAMRNGKLVLATLQGEVLFLQIERKLYADYICN